MEKLENCLKKLDMMSNEDVVLKISDTLAIIQEVHNEIYDYIIEFSKIREDLLENIKHDVSDIDIIDAFKELKEILF